VILNCSFDCLLLDDSFKDEAAAHKLPFEHSLAFSLLVLHPMAIQGRA
jgi:hypothetical protein